MYVFVYVCVCVCTCVCAQVHVLMSSLSLSLSLTFYMHAGPHRGVPAQLASQNNRAAVISRSLIPDVDTAVAMYEASGGHLSTPSGFGTDPIAGSPELLRYRENEMEQNIPSPEDLFGWTVNGITQPFADSLKFMIDTSIHLQRFV